MYTLSSPKLRNESASGVWRAGDPVVIDLGTYETRVGVASLDLPSHSYTSVTSKYKDRKSSNLISFIGDDVYTDATARKIAKYIYEGPHINNWDSLEMLLDHSFDMLGINSHGLLDSPIVATELMAVPQATRSSLQELFFEGYGVPSTLFGIDSLFAYKQNHSSNSSGVIVSCGHEACYILPVNKGAGDIANAKRINWGGRKAAEYMQNLLVLKYPFFPSSVSLEQSGALVREHCYVAQNFAKECSHFLDLEGLELRERIIQTSMASQQKAAEDLAQVLERRKESGRRLQERAAQAREAKLRKQEDELSQLEALEDESDSVLASHGFSSRSRFETAINKLRKSVRLAHGENISENDQEPDHSLVDVPDSELDLAQIKEKRKQRLLKANYDARQRTKAERQAALQQKQYLEQKDAEWRQSDLKGWIEAKRKGLSEALTRRREKKRLRAELKDRKSAASQKRARSFALLAAEGMVDLDDGFGAKDEDWEVYRVQDEEEETDQDEQEQETIDTLEQLLLEHDPDFDPVEFEDAGRDWRRSIVHKFLYGAHPLDISSHTQSHQLNLNTERIRIPEVMFQPSIVGLDQAGLSEVLSGVLLRSSTGIELAKNIFLTGGMCKFDGMIERIRSDIQCSLPQGSQINVRQASDCTLDAWRGAASFARDTENAGLYVSKNDYLENGPDYIRHHTLGNVV